MDIVFEGEPTRPELFLLGFFIFPLFARQLHPYPPFQYGSLSFFLALKDAATPFFPKGAISFPDFSSFLSRNSSCH